MDYGTFFRRATTTDEHPAGFPPLPYQERLATEPWPDLIDVPTGLGKTAAVIVAWLWKVFRGKGDAPRRLVYCLPMRSLVKQTAATARSCVEALRETWARAATPVPGVFVLLGGDLDDGWILQPENPQILIGTQDLLLSRALQRGYAMNPFNWPIHFGLLNNDALWVYDETQLLGVGLETSAQLAGLRSALGTRGRCVSIWMSATLAAGRLQTYDHKRPDEDIATLRLDGQDKEEPVVQTRITSKKHCSRLADLTIEGDAARYGKALAARIVELASSGLTLVVVNQVARARAVYRALQGHVERVGLIHSRFRAPDRARAEAVLTGKGDRVLVATQAIEAGVDVSAEVLITELAPWSSLVQRFGRCNRYGEHARGGQVHWIDYADPAKDGDLLPYTREQIAAARARLSRIDDVGIQTLKGVSPPEELTIRPVLRRRDLLGLFDTSPDLSGNLLDVSPFIRDTGDTDVHVYWRDFAGERPDSEDTRRAMRDEMCRVSVGALSKFLDRLKKKRKKEKRKGIWQAWRWNPLERAWEEGKAWPGATLLLHSAVGGYAADLGWTGDPADAPVPEVAVADTREALEGRFPEALDDDPLTDVGRWVELSVHLEDVAQEVEAISADLGLSDQHRWALKTAALWHDTGKAHPVFQGMLTGSKEGSDPTYRPPAEGELWAKSNHRGGRHSRPHFRHELASALLWLQVGPERPERDLVAYLIAAHHGKVRLSIRAMPGENEPDEGGRLFARGVWDGDELPEITLPGGRRIAPTRLQLETMMLGRGSWVERAARLVESWGPFVLADLEALVRIADWRASRKESSHARSS